MSPPGALTGAPAAKLNLDPFPSSRFVQYSVMGQTNTDAAPIRAAN